MIGPMDRILKLVVKNTHDIFSQRKPEKTQESTNIKIIKLSDFI